MAPIPEQDEVWPELPYAAWQDTCTTLHLWTQMAGKIRCARTPWLNHSWHVTLYVSLRGLTTSPIPDGQRSFEIEFDFLVHRLVITTTSGARAEIALVPRSVADFFADFTAALNGLGIHVPISELPSEIAGAIASAATGFTPPTIPNTRSVSGAHWFKPTAS